MARGKKQTIPIVLHLEPLFPVYVWYMPGIYNVYVDLNEIHGIYMVLFIGISLDIPFITTRLVDIHGTSFTMYIHQVYTWYIHEYTWYII